MKKIITLFLLSFLFQFCLQAQCEEEDEVKVLLVGDSWAFFMSSDMTFNTIFERWGFSNYKYISSVGLAENGAQTDDFLEAGKQEEIQEFLDDIPSIKAVHLSIGGNDFLGAWNVDMTEAEVDSMKADVLGRLEQIVDFIKQARPGITIVLSGYTYPNFEEVIEDSSPLQAFHPFYDLWESMGFPSFLQINTLLNEVTDDMSDYAAADPQIEFVNATGILQYTFGQDDPVGVPPGGTYPAGTTPLPIGLPDMPSPKESMRDYVLTRDCFHLSPRGYRDFISYQTRKFYHKFLMDDKFLIANNASFNGAISSSNSISTDLLLGEMNGESYSTILTFNTPAIPSDAQIEQAQIFLRINDVEGNNPIGSELEVKVKSGSFGSSFEVEIGDDMEDADIEETTCRFGSDDEGHWIRLDLPSEMIPFINHTSATQFIISAPNANGGMITFSASDEHELAPVLNLRYDPSFTSAIADLEDWRNDILLFPNPTSGMLQIENNGVTIKSVQVLSMIGKSLGQYDPSLGSIDLSGLPKGIYLIRLMTEKGMLTRKVMKQ